MMIQSKLRWAGLALAAALALNPGVSAAAEGMKLIFCGTSGPLPIPDRAKSCLAVEAGGKLYLFDVGPESAKTLMTVRAPVGSLAAVFITHLHSDHIGDLGEINLQSWVQGRAQPLKVIGPAGVADLVAGFNQAYGPDHGFRHAHHDHGAVKLPLDAGLMTATTISPPSAPEGSPSEAQAYADGDFKVTAIVVNHSPVSPAFGYRIDYKGRSVVISGDTRKWPPLARAAEGADVIVHEAQNADMTRTLSRGLFMLGQGRMSSIMADTLSYHTTPVEAAEIAKSAGVAHLVLSHLTQAGLPFYTPEKFLAGVDTVGVPDVRLAFDRMTITLPEGSKAVIFGKD